MGFIELRKKTLNWNVFLIIGALWAISLFIYKFLPNTMIVFPIAALSSFLLILAMFYPQKTMDIVDFCFRYRYIVAVIVFLFCIVFQLSGSSIGIYNNFLPTQIKANTSTIFGIPRDIRSDEFGVSTPTYFSQYYNHHRLSSHQMSLSQTNMILDYYSPVWDITAIGKPLMWGFLLFGNAVGISWYWCGEVILIFMTALEMFLILTKGRRIESLIGGVMIALSPEIQWWMMPHMPIVIMYTMGLFCISYHFFMEKSFLKKWIFSILSVIAGVGFCLSIFPSFQVPCAYIIIILLIVCLIRDRENIVFNRKHIFCILFILVSMISIVSYFFWVSKSDLDLLMNTVYPGKRICLGGDTKISYLFSNISSLFIPYKNSTYLNNCEVSNYIHVAPFFILLSPKIFLFLKRKGDKNVLIGKALLGILIVEIFFMIIGFPHFLANISFLRCCNRMHAIYDWTATIFTIWGLSVLLKWPDLFKKWEKILYPLLYGVISLIQIDSDVRDFFASFKEYGIPNEWMIILPVIMVFVIILLFAMFKNVQLLSGALILIMIFCGATVNPIEHGIDAVTNHPISKTVTEISSREPNSRWLCTNSIFYFSNLLMANGAQVLNATNFYPDQKKWDIIDQEGLFDFETNRYANQGADIVENENSIEMINADQIMIHLEPNTLKTLDIQYLFSSVDYTNLLAKYSISCTLITEQDGYGIYKLNY